jgi:hypothetical protein
MDEQEDAPPHTLKCPTLRNVLFFSIIVASVPVWFLDVPWLRMTDSPWLHFALYIVYAAMVDVIYSNVRKLARC